MNYPDYLRTASFACLLFLLTGSFLFGQPCLGEMVWEASTGDAEDLPLSFDIRNGTDLAVLTPSRIWLSTDGGDNWRAGFTAVSGTRLERISLAAPGHVVAVYSFSESINGVEYTSSVLIASTDGGGTWEEYLWGTPNRIQDVVMYDAGYGVAVSQNNRMTGDSVFYTTDGGMTWTSVPYPPGTAYSGDVYVPGSAGWAMWALDSADGNQYLYRTDDRGTTWRRSVEPLPWISTLLFQSEDVVWGAGGKTVTGSISQGIISKSTDGGITWNQVLANGFNEKLRFRQIDFSDERHGLIYGSDGRLLETMDGGEHWVPIGSVGGLEQMRYSDAGELVMLTDRELYICSDAVKVAAPSITAPTHNLEHHQLLTTLSWTPDHTADSYEVQVGDTTYEGTFTDVEFVIDPYLDLTGVTTTSIQLELEPHRRYGIRVRARRGDQVSEWSDILILATGERADLPAPVFLRPAQATTDHPLDPELVWSSVPNSAGYDLAVARTPDFFTPDYNEVGLPDTAYQLDDLLPGTLYYCRVRARDGSGAASPWSTDISGLFYFTTEGSSSVSAGSSGAVSVLLQPNVAGDHAELVMNAAEPVRARVELVDMAGTVLNREELPGPVSGVWRHRLDLTGLQPGRYIVLLQCDGKRYELPLTVVR